MSGGLEKRSLLFFFWGVEKTEDCFFSFQIDLALPLLGWSQVEQMMMTGTYIYCYW